MSQQNSRRAVDPGGRNSWRVTPTALWTFALIQVAFLAWAVYELLTNVQGAGDYCYDETYAGTRSVEECVETARYWAGLPVTGVVLMWFVVDAALVALYFAWRAAARSDEPRP